MKQSFDVVSNTILIMGYYLRVLGTQDPDIHLDELLDKLQEVGLKAKIAHADDEQPNNWTILEIANYEGKPVAQLERNPVIDGELGEEELNEFKDEIEDCEPASAVEWLLEYFERIKVIYAFQVLNAGFEDNNYEILSSIRSTIWGMTGGILQADGEGFTNEDGYHILWQFGDSVTGEWSCAVKNLSGWQSFTMELGNLMQREEFKKGKVPKNAIQI